MIEILANRTYRCLSAQVVALLGTGLLTVAREPAVQSVHFDPDTGIKTTIMTDGAVQEEPFEPRAGVGRGRAAPKPRACQCTRKGTPDN